MRTQSVGVRQMSPSGAHLAVSLVNEIQYIRSYMPGHVHEPH